MREPTGRCRRRTRLIPDCILLAVASLATAYPAHRVHAQVVAAEAPAPTAFADAIAQARATVTAVMDEQSIPGMSVAVLIDGDVVWSEGFGFANLEHRVPVTTLTRMRIGSVSKPVTAAAIGRLVEQGRLDLDAPVQRYVPSFPEKRWPITTRQAAGHTAGIRHYRGGEFLSRDRYPTVTEGLAIFQDDTLLFQPGTGYQYSSYGWNLVSAVIEGATGEEFLEHMRREVFEPLGLRSIVAEHTDSIIQHRADFYERDDESGRVLNAEYVDNSYKWAGGGFISNTEDMVRFGWAHLDGSFLRPGTVAELFTSQRIADGSATNYGIGWRSGTDKAGRRWVGHTGGSVGGRAILTLYPDARVVVAALANLGSAPMTPELAERLAAPFISAAADRVGSAANPRGASYDLLLRNGRIVDGTGNPWYVGDIAVRGDEIVHIAPTIDGSVKRVIDLAGQVIAPGFIDIHTHARRGIFERPTADNYVRQGVTTLVEGPDGSSPLPLAPFLAALDSIGTSVNMASFVGQGSVRSEVMGNADRAATPAEIEQMRAIVRRSMEEGAFGLSSGLFYTPGAFTPTAEVVELAGVAGALGGIHISHMRDEAAGVVTSVEETIRIGEEGGLPTQVTHHKVVGPGYWGASVETLRRIDEARARGVDATIDQYPYTASSTSVQSALLPAWALEGDRAAVRARLNDAATRARIRAESAEIIRLERGGGDPKNVVIVRCSWDPSLAGKTLADVTRQRGMEPTLENAAETVLWITAQGGCSGVFHAMNEDDIERIMRHPATMIASDGEIPEPGSGHPHPRSYGTFARVLGTYVRERGTLTLEEAVRKMSAFPAQRLGLEDRGVLRPGMKADFAVFDPARVRDVATFDQPHQYAEGFSLVVVNGAVVFEDGRMTDARPGRVLYGPGTLLH